MRKHSVEQKRDYLFSIRPAYAEKIVDGTKTVELRRKFAQVVAPGSTALIYCTSPVKAIIGSAEIADVLCLPTSEIWRVYNKVACITRKDFDAYFDGVSEGYVIELCRSKRLARALELADLKKRFGFMPPQSYRYVPQELHPLISHGRLQNTHRH